MNLTKDNIRVCHEDAYFSGNELIIATNDQEKVKKQILKDQKIRERVEEKLKNLPINCRVCGERLEMGGNVHGQSWHCDDHTGYNDEGRVYKKGRSLCDEHYEKSSIYMELDKFRMYEQFENTLKGFLGKRK
ncbi:hypothetical protein LCGC14_0586210 [marine sediment metagenome]|uniref:Uncharacterized protein n=1 Tax=marine sediment metagenome TaxID=412755 RepID=A0A0F9REU4_9ZZZZ